LVQIEVAAIEYLPTAHAPVTADSPAVAQYDPAGQAKHKVDAVEGANVPVEQLAQNVEEKEADRVPT